MRKYTLDLPPVPYKSYTLSLIIQTLVKMLCVLPPPLLVRSHLCLSLSSLYASAETKDEAIEVGESDEGEMLHYTDMLVTTNPLLL